MRKTNTSLRKTDTLREPIILREPHIVGRGDFPQTKSVTAAVGTRPRFGRAVLRRN
jgi:hypothetical protein